MPFKHNDEIHHKILREPQFESDESFQLDDDEAFEENKEKLTNQTNVIDAMQKTIEKMKVTIQDEKRTGGQSNFSFASKLKRGVEIIHGEIDGLQDDYVQNSYNSDEEKEKIISEKLMNS